MMAIVSKGRANAQVTYNYLVNNGVTDIEIYVYENDVERYEMACPKATIVTGPYKNLVEKRRFIIQRYMDNGENGVFILDDDIKQMQLKLQKQWHTGTLLGKQIEITVRDMLKSIETVAQNEKVAMISATFQAMASMNIEKVYKNKGKINTAYYVNTNVLRERNYNPFDFEAPNIVEDQKMSALLYKNDIPFIHMAHWYISLPKFGSQTGGHVNEYLAQLGGHFPDTFEEYEDFNKLTNLVREHLKEEEEEGLVSFPTRKGRLILQYAAKNRVLMPTFNEDLEKIVESVTGKPVEFKLPKQKKNL